MKLSGGRIKQKKKRNLKRIFSLSFIISEIKSRHHFNPNFPIDEM
jgi:uncharacterized protein Veg